MLFTEIKIMQETLLFFSSPFLFFILFYFLVENSPIYSVCAVTRILSKPCPTNEPGFKSLLRTFQGQEIES
jgi:hypothetical protein